MKRAVIILPRGEKPAHVITQSLLPETDRAILRTTVNLGEDDRGAFLDICAEDTNALRAAVNSYLRWISVSWDTYQETRKTG